MSIGLCHLWIFSEVLACTLFFFYFGSYASLFYTFVIFYEIFVIEFEFILAKIVKILQRASKQLFIGYIFLNLIFLCFLLEVSFLYFQLIFCQFMKSIVSFMKVFEQKGLIRYFLSLNTIFINFSSIIFVSFMDDIFFLLVIFICIIKKLLQIIFPNYFFQFFFFCFFYNVFPSIKYFLHSHLI